MSAIAYKPPWQEGVAYKASKDPLVPPTLPTAPDTTGRQTAPTSKAAVIDMDGMPLAPPIRSDYKFKLERFSAEYMVDFNACAAALRIGASEKAIACGYASKLFNEPYTQQLIVRHINEWEEDAICSRNQVKAALWRESNYYGPDGSASARVAALGKLSKLMGMEIQRIEVNHQVTGVMIVPMTSPEEWATLAQKSQQHLKEQVIEVEAETRAPE